MNCHVKLHDPKRVVYGASVLTCAHKNECSGVYHSTLLVPLKSFKDFRKTNHSALLGSSRQDVDKGSAYREVVSIVR